MGIVRNQRYIIVIPVIFKVNFLFLKNKYVNGVSFAPTCRKFVCSGTGTNQASVQHYIYVYKAFNTKNFLNFLFVF